MWVPSFGGVVQLFSQPGFSLSCTLPYTPLCCDLRKTFKSQECDARETRDGSRYIPAHWPCPLECLRQEFLDRNCCHLLPNTMGLWPPMGSWWVSDLLKSVTFLRHVHHSATGSAVSTLLISVTPFCNWDLLCLHYSYQWRPSVTGTYCVYTTHISDVLL
jgi:hypothetical protein